MTRARRAREAISGLYLARKESSSFLGFAALTDFAIRRLRNLSTPIHVASCYATADKLATVGARLSSWETLTGKLRSARHGCARVPGSDDFQGSKTGCDSCRAGIDETAMAVRTSAHTVRDHGASGVARRFHRTRARATCA